MDVYLVYANQQILSDSTENSAVLTYYAPHSDNRIIGIFSNQEAARLAISEEYKINKTHIIHVETKQKIEVYYIINTTLGTIIATLMKYELNVINKDYMNTYIV